jgi:hypothetical protein
VQPKLLQFLTKEQAARKRAKLAQQQQRRRRTGGGAIPSDDDDDEEEQDAVGGGKAPKPPPSPAAKRDLLVDYVLHKLELNWNRQNVSSLGVRSFSHCNPFLFLQPLLN